MVVADDEVDAQLLGIGNLFDCLYAAVEDYNQLHACFPGIVYAFAAHSVALVVAVGDVVVDVGVELAQKLIHQRYCRATVHIVVAVDKDALLAPHGIVEPVHRKIHILHQERIYQVGKLRTEEALGSRLGGDAALDEEHGKHGADAQLLSKLVGRLLLGGGWRLIIPFELHYIYLSFFISAALVEDICPQCNLLVKLLITM